MKRGMTARDRAILDADITPLASPQGDASLGRELEVANLPRYEGNE
jgi:hypothetical protein